jgi:ABC-type transporter Mla maintaining outer membrane lipid asymmetry ATPase subunit MlaF
MLYDEPTNGLDPRMASNVTDLINRLVEFKQVTSIVVTHQIADAFELADKFIIIDHGQMVFDGNMTQLQKSEDERVVDFLRPFRESVANVKKIDFI